MRALADLFAALEQDEGLSNAAAPEVEFRDGEPQRNVVLEALDRVSAGGSREAIEGFCLALTGILALNASGMAPDSSFLASLAEDERRLVAARDDAQLRDFLSAAAAAVG